MAPVLTLLTLRHGFLVYVGFDIDPRALEIPCFCRYILQGGSLADCHHIDGVFCFFELFDCLHWYAYFQEFGFEIVFPDVSVHSLDYICKCTFCAWRKSVKGELSPVSGDKLLVVREIFVIYHSSVTRELLVVVS